MPRVDYTETWTVVKKELASPHIDVTFKRTSGSERTLRFTTGADTHFAQGLRLGETLTMTLKRSDRQ